MKKFITIALTAAAICSCARKPLSEAQGSLSLGVEFNESSKAAMTEEELTASSLVKIYKADFSGMVRQYKYSEAPAVIYLPVEEYRVDVEAGEMVKDNPAVASWEQKSYKGSANFTITAGNNIPVAVVAGVANAVTKVTFDPTIAENFGTNFYFSIGLDAADNNKCLKYDSTNSGKEGYFIPSGFEPALYWKFWGTLTKDGSSVIKSGTIENVEKGKLYKMSPKFTIHDGDLSFNLLVDYATEIINDMVIFEPVSTGLFSSTKDEIWAGHATVHADVDENEFSDPSKIKFAYAESGTSNWTTVASTRVSEGVYDGKMTGLKGSTAYQYKLMINDEQVGDPLTLTTAEAPQLPNNGFEEVSNAESSRYVSFYNPSSSLVECRTKFWDNGSYASAGMMGADYAICYSDSDVPSGIGSTKSARLQSIYAVVKLAAGNLFTGEFFEISGTDGKVNFGRPFTARPTGVRFWYKYKGGAVDYAPSGSPISTGDQDIACVQIALGNWDYKKYGGTKISPVQVNTADKSTFWKYESLPETVAYGKFEKTGTTGWQQVTVTLDYKSLKTFPTYIIVSAAASKYGDYYAGYSKSALYLDNFELVYE